MSKKYVYFIRVLVTLMAIVQFFMIFKLGSFKKTEKMRYSRFLKLEVQSRSNHDDVKINLIIFKIQINVLNV